MDEKAGISSGDVWGRQRLQKVGSLSGCYSAERLPIEIWEADDGGYEIVALNEGGFSSTGVDLDGLLMFLSEDNGAKIARRLGWQITALTGIDPRSKP